MRELVKSKIRKKYTTTWLCELGIDFLNHGRKTKNKRLFPYDPNANVADVDFDFNMFHTCKMSKHELDVTLEMATDEELLFMLDNLACQAYR